MGDIGSNNSIYVRAIGIIERGAKMGWKEKLKSRKLWAAIVGVITGLAMVFGLDQTIITTISGAVTVCTSVAAYIITEGKIDAQAIKTAIEAVQTAMSAVHEGKDNE